MQNNIQTTLEKIQKAKNITESLLSKVAFMAEFIANEMCELGLDSLANGKYEISERLALRHAEAHLQVETTGANNEPLFVRLNSQEVSPIHEVKYLYGDFSAAYIVPNKSDIFTFLEDLPVLFDELSNYRDLISHEQLLGQLVETIENFKQAA